MKLTENQYKQFLNIKTSKYKAQKTTINEITYDSKKEAIRGLKLSQMEQLGIIKDLQRQVKYELQPTFKHNGKTIRAINYIADFTYTIVDTNEFVVEDVKGLRIETYKIKKKLFMYKYGIEIKEV